MSCAKSRSAKVWSVRAGVLAALSALVLGAGFGGVASAAVRWDLRSEANTQAAPGSQQSFMLRIGNTGDASSAGSVTLAGALPPGMTYASGTAISTSWDCSATAVGARTISCTNADVFDPNLLGPSVAPHLRITVDVDPDANVSGGLRTVHFEVSGGGAGAVADAIDDPTLVTRDPLAFDVEAFDGQVVDANEAAFSQAGGRPYAISTQIDLTRGNDVLQGPFWPVEPLKDVVVDLPPGVVGNPTAVERCTPAELANSSNILGRPLCPIGSQIGVVTVKAARGQSGLDYRAGVFSLYNMVPPANAPARFGFNVLGSVVTLDVRVRSGGDYGVTVDAKYNPEALAIIGTELTIWGAPADPSHDPQRSCPGLAQPIDGGPTCAPTGRPVPFLRNPTSCTAPAGHPVQDGLVTTLYADSWLNPGRLLPDGSPDPTDSAWKSRDFVSHDNPGYPANPADPTTPWGAHLLPTNCAALPFAPTLDGRPTGSSAVSTPSAFAFDLALPQHDEDPNGIATADLKQAVVTLPAGVRVSPSSAHGLEGCSPTQIGLRSAADPTCPGASKIGTMTIETALLEEPLEGSIYLATPRDNPFDNLITIYLHARGPGVNIKLAGKISPDPRTGQMTATFDDNPQLPFDTLHLEFKGGPRAPIVTPDLCGSYTTNATFTSWSGRTVSTTSAFTVSGDGAGGACPANRAFSPRFNAGTADPVAGAESPFTLSVSRGDLDQQLGGLTVEMPPGLLGTIKNVALCSEADAAKGTCGEASRIGSVTVGAGAGPNPFYITNGRAYITEAYGGGSFGMSIVVPAKAGPFDLGDVNVRAAIHIDPTTAQLRVVSDPLPTILEGIPLDVRDVRVKVDRPDFIVNPTSCQPKTVGGTFQSTTGAVSEGTSRFQVGKCDELELNPRMQIVVGRRGRTRRGYSVPFRTTLRQSAGQSNLKAVAVTLPTSLNARLTVVNRACTLAEYKADDCERARAGSAIAHTPLLAEPLSGGVYFVRNGNPLPDLMVALRGQVDIDLAGKVTIPGSTHLSTRFETVPDAPITSFELRLVAGPKGPIGVAQNLCSARARRKTAKIAIRGQNGDLVRMRPHLKVEGCARRSAARRGR